MICEEEGSAGLGKRQSRDSIVPRIGCPEYKENCGNNSTLIITIFVKLRTPNN